MIFDRVQSIQEIFDENQRRMEAAPKGTREVPAVVDTDKWRAVEQYAAFHVHNLEGTCVKNVWWREDGFCHVGHNA